MDSIKKYKQPIIIGTFFAILFLLGIKSKMEKNQLYKDPVFILTSISGTNPASKGGIDIDYIYYVNGTKYEGAGRCFEVNAKHADEFLNKPVIVAYSYSHPQYSELLLLAKDFTDFKISMPDTMRWIYHYVN